MEEFSTYDMLVNAAGEILIVINKINGEPQDPRCEHDGSDCAVLFKNKDEAITLTGLSEEAESLLGTVDTILIVEVENGEPICEYNATVKHLKNGE